MGSNYFLRVSYDAAYWLLHHYFTTQCVGQYHCSYTLSLTLVYYRTCIKFRGVQIFVVFVAYLFPTKINAPQLIFLPILPHRCIQRLIKFSVDIDHDIKIDVSSLLLGDHEAHHENSCLLPVTSYCSYGFAM